MDTTTQALLPLSLCAKICGLTSKEMIIGAKPRPEHEALAARYFYSPSAVKASMRGAMVSAIRTALRADQNCFAAELLVALRTMLAGNRSNSIAALSQHRRSLPQCRRPVERLIESLGSKRARPNVEEWRDARVLSARPAREAALRPINLERRAIFLRPGAEATHGA